MSLDEARPATGTEIKDADCGCGPTRSDATKDCIDACQKAYDACIANAGSDLEKAVCNTAHSQCVANC